MNFRHRAVITGVGVLAANGIGKDEFWASLSAGKSGIGPITRFDTTDLPCKIAGEVRDFDPELFIDPALKPRRRMGRFTQLGLAATRMAIDDAGVERKYLSQLPELPIVIGVSTDAQDLRSQKPGLFTAIAGIPSAAASAIGYQYSARPRLRTISDGCASGMDAVGAAAEIIRSGDADIAIAGGAEGSVERYAIEIMLKCHRCSTRNDQPQKASCPFDLNRDYGVMAEGAGIVVIENLNHALARGARIYGEILSYGSCADPADAEEGGGLADSMRLALEHAGLPAREVDYVSAHGPSDIDMDRTETEAIKAALGEWAMRTPVSSAKGVFGCPMGAAGVIQLVGACLTLENQMLPPTANYEHPDPRCDLDYIPRARSAEVNTILVNTHGFGRHNGSLLLRRTDRP